MPRKGMGLTLSVESLRGRTPRCEVRLSGWAIAAAPRIAAMPEFDHWAFLRMAEVIATTSFATSRTASIDILDIILALQEELRLCDLAFSDMSGFRV